MSGWMPLLHPEMTIQIHTGSGGSKQGTLWRVLLPVPWLSGNYSGRQLSRGLCQIVSLVSSSFTGCSKGLCGMCWTYQSHETVVLQPTAMLRHTNKAFNVCWWLNVYAAFNLLSSSNCSWHCVILLLAEQGWWAAEEKNNCRVLFSGSEEVVLLPSCWDKNKVKLLHLFLHNLEICSFQWKKASTIY